MKSIILTPHEAAAIQAGQQTQFTRVIKDDAINSDPKQWYGIRQIAGPIWGMNANGSGKRAVHDLQTFKNPYIPGSILWGRETFCLCNSAEGPCIAYRSDGMGITWRDFCVDKCPDGSMNYKKYPGGYTQWWDDLWSEDGPWRPSTQMPLWAARTYIKVTRAWICPVREISGENCCREGVVTLTELNAMLSVTNKTPFHRQNEDTAREIFRHLWDAQNPKHPYSENPWVIRCEIEKVKKPCEP